MKILNPYLIFAGNCRKAMTFYHKCLGGVLFLSTYAKTPGGCPPDFPKKFQKRIMHARLTIKTLVIMASDTRPDIRIKQGNNFFISITCDSIDEAERFFKGLRLKGKIEMPLQETFWAWRFGMLTDQFGVKWMITMDKPK